MMLVNGKSAEAVPADDRGLAYGDGVFETMRVRRARLPLLDRHLDRLRRGLRALDIPWPAEDALREDLAQAAAHVPDGVVKLIVTRGSGGRGYRAPLPPAPRRIVQAMSPPDHVARWQREGVAVRICRTQLAGQPELAGLKHLNRLSQVLARAEWQDEFDEGLMRDADGYLVEGTMSNLFVLRYGVLFAPPVGVGVAGVLRELVLRLGAESGIKVREEHLADRDIEAAEEIFVTNSVIGVCPVRRFASRDIPVGTITRQLQTAVDKELDRLACESF